MALRDGKKIARRFGTPPPVEPAPAVDVQQGARSAGQSVRERGPVLPPGWDAVKWRETPLHEITNIPRLPRSEHGNLAMARMPSPTGNAGQLTALEASKTSWGKLVSAPFSSPTFDWTQLTVEQKRDILSDPAFSISKVTAPGQQGLILSDPEFGMFGGSWEDIGERITDPNRPSKPGDKLQWWQPVMFSALSNPYTAPLAQAGALMVMTKGQGLPLAAGMTASAYISMLKGNENPVLNAMGTLAEKPLQAFMWGSQTWEQAAGLAKYLSADSKRVGQAPYTPEEMKLVKERVNTFLQNPSGVWDAMKIFYESRSGNMSVINAMANKWIENAPDWQKDHLRATMNDILPVLKKDNEVFMLGERGPVMVEPGYTLEDAVRRVVEEKESPDMVLADYQRVYGLSGVALDFVAQSVYDPLNYIPSATAEVRANISERRATRLEQTIRDLGVPTEEQVARLQVEKIKTDVYRATDDMTGATMPWSRTARNMRSEMRTRLEPSQYKYLTAWERNIAGVDANGKIIELSPDATTSRVPEIIKKFTTLNAESKVYLSAHMLKENLGLLLNWSESAPEMLRVLKAAAAGDMEAVKDMGAQFLNNAEFYTSIGGVRGFVPEMERITSNFELAKSNRDLFWELQTALKEKPGDLLKNLTGDAAEIEVQRIVNKLRQSGETKLTARFASGELNAKVLSETFKPFTEGVPIHITEFKGVVLDKFYEHMGKWGVEYYGVKNASQFEEALRMMKGAQSLMLLDLSPSYLINNFLNNRVLMAAGGVFGLTPTAKMKEWFDLFGVNPARVDAGFGPTGDNLLSGEIKTVERLVEEAGRGKGIMTKGADLIGKVRRANPLSANKASARIEAHSSMQMYYSTMRQYYGRNWKVGRGFDRMPSGLEASLKAQGIDVDVLYRNIENVLSPKEFDQLLKTTTNRNVQTYINHAAELMGRDPSDLSAMLSSLGVMDELKQMIDAAKSQEEAQRAFDVLEDRVNQHLDIQSAQELISHAEHVQNKIKTEGPAGVLDVFNDLVLENLDRKIENDRIWDEAYARVEEADNYALIHQELERAASLNHSAWRRSQSHEASATKGVIEGLGLDSKFKQEFLTRVTKQSTILEKYFEEKNNAYKKYFRTLFKNKRERYAARQALDIEMNQKFTEAQREVLALQSELDNLFVAEFERNFGQPGGAMARKWREGVLKISTDMHETITAFRASLLGLDFEQRKYAWEQFKPEYQKMWRERAKENMDGAASLYKWDEHADVVAKDKETRANLEGLEKVRIETASANVDKIASDEGFPTANEDGTPIPNARLEILKIVKKYGGSEGAKVRNYHDLEGMPDLVRKAFENKRLREKLQQELPFDQGVKTANESLANPEAVQAAKDASALLPDPDVTDSVIDFDVPKLIQEVQSVHIAELRPEQREPLVFMLGNMKEQLSQERRSLWDAIRLLGGIDPKYAKEMFGMSPNEIGMPPGFWKINGADPYKMTQWLIGEHWSLDTDIFSSEGLIKLIEKEKGRKPSWIDVYVGKKREDALFAIDALMHGLDKPAQVLYRDLKVLAATMLADDPRILERFDWAKAWGMDKDLLYKWETRMNELERSLIVNIGNEKGLSNLWDEFVSWSERFPLERIDANRPNSSETYGDFMDRVRNSLLEELENTARENEISKAEAEAEIKIKSALDHAEAVMTRDALRNKFVSEMGATVEQADAYMRVLDRIADWYGRQTGEDPEQFYARYYKEVKRAKYSSDFEGLFQYQRITGGADRTMGLVDYENYARMLVRGGEGEIRSAVRNEPNKESRKALLNAIHDLDAQLAERVATDMLDLLFQRNKPKTDTPEFREFFGKSKVIDGNGKPLIVWHGTDAIFDRFDTTDFGSWFGDKGTAGKYTRKNALDNPPRLEAFYLRAEKPFKINFDLSEDLEIKSFIRAINKDNGTAFTAQQLGLTDLSDLYTVRGDNMAPGWYMVSFNDKFFEAVKAKGFDSIFALEEGKWTYNVFTPEQVKSVDNNGSFGLDDPRFLFQDAGAVVQFDRVKATITAFEGSNITTVVHENAHIWRKMMEDVAQRTGNPQIVKDLETLRGWTAETIAAINQKIANGEELSAFEQTVSNGRQIDVVSGSWNRGQEEVFARAVERYMTDGELPFAKGTPIHGVMENIKMWMLSIYRSLVGSEIDVKIPDNVRDVFDRLIGRDDATVTAGDGAQFKVGDEVFYADGAWILTGIADNGNITLRRASTGDIAVVDPKRISAMLKQKVEIDQVARAKQTQDTLDALRENDAFQDALAKVRASRKARTEEALSIGEDQGTAGGMLPGMQDTTGRIIDVQPGSGKIRKMDAPNARTIYDVVPGKIRQDVKGVDINPSDMVEFGGRYYQVKGFNLRGQLVTDGYKLLDPLKVTRVASQGNMFEPAFYHVDDFRQPRNVMRETVSLRSGLENLKDYGIDLDNIPNKGYKTRVLAAALEQRQRDKYGHIGLTDYSPEASAKIADWIAQEVQFEMGHPEQSGVGWYSEKFQAALDVMGEVIPDLKTNKTSRDIFTLFLAITSDGTKVMDQMNMAVALYEQYKKKNNLQNLSIAHSKAESLSKSLGYIATLENKLGGIEPMMEYLLRAMTVSDNKMLADEMGIPYQPSQYKVSEIVPLAAIILGPKLGAFFANLMGDSGYLTMDRWWSRTFNRMRGDLIANPTESSLERLKGLIGPKSKKWSYDKLVAYTGTLAKEYEANNFWTPLEKKVKRKETLKLSDREKFRKDAKKYDPTGALLKEHELIKAANNVYKFATEKLIEKPMSGSDREFMINTVKRAQVLLKQQGVDMSIADIQATLWYYEKRLYAEQGVRETDVVSYFDAAANYLRRIKGQSELFSEPDISGSFKDEPAGLYRATVEGRSPVDEDVYIFREGKTTVDLTPLPERIGLARNKAPYDPEFGSKMLNGIAEYFQFTDDPRKAAFMLPDGRMLDFTKGGSPIRNVDHVEISRVTGGGDPVRSFLKYTQSMRMDYWDTGLVVEISHPITSEQARAIQDIADVFDGDVLIDMIVSDDKDANEYISLGPYNSQKFNARRVKKMIDEIYKGDIPPADLEKSIRSQIFHEESIDAILYDKKRYPSAAKKSGASKKEVDAYKDAVIEVESMKRSRNWLANAVAKDFEDKGYTQLVGKKIKSVHDLAILAQVYRNPRFETFRWFFTKGNKVVGQTSITSRLPGQTLSTVEAMDLDVVTIREMMNALDADGYYVMHNHPSGQVSPSPDDMRSTAGLIYLLDGYKGHVVINHGKYTVITGTKEPGGIRLDKRQYTLDPSLILETYKENSPPTLEHYMLGTEIDSVETLISLWQDLVRDDKKHIVAIGVAATSALRGMMEISEQELLRRGLPALLHFGRQCGSNSLFLVGVPMGLMEFSKKMIANDLLVDVIMEDGTSIRGSMKIDLDPNYSYGLREEQIYSRTKMREEKVPLLPPGGYDQLSGYMSMGKTLDDGWRDQVKPMWDAMRKSAGSPETQFSFEGIDASTMRQLNQYLNQVRGRNSDTKHGAIRWGETQRDFALLNYQRQYGFDRLFSGVVPYEFYGTRSMFNHMTRVMDRPAWISTYARLRNLSNTYQSQLPERTRGKFFIPMPFLPEWAGGGMWIDPTYQMYPWRQFVQPLEAYTRDQNNLSNSAVYILRNWGEDGTIESAVAQNAIETRMGPEWERALEQARIDQGESANTGSDYFSMLFSPALYATLPYYLLTGKRAGAMGWPTGQLPVTRFGQGVETAFKDTPLEWIGNAAGLLAKPEKWAREKLGLPEFGNWGQYYIDRQLANMAAEGKYDYREVNKAMIEKSGPIYDEAVERVRQELMLRVPGLAPLYGIAHGAMFDKVVGALLPSLFPGGLLPPGEMEYKGLKQEYGLAWKAREKGDKQAINRFFEEHPEYASRLALRRDPSERLEQFLRSEIWDAYTALGPTDRKSATAQLGPDFGDFLDADPGVNFSIEQLATWAKMLNRMVPKTEETMPVIEGELPDIQYLDEATRRVTDRYFTERKTQFPNYYELEQKYYNLPVGDRNRFMLEHPEYAEYKKWKKKWYDARPDLIQFFNGEYFRSMDFTGWPSMLLEMVQLYALTGDDLPEPAEEILQALWVKEGQPYDDFDVWMENSVAPSIRNQMRFQVIQ